MRMQLKDRINRCWANDGRLLAKLSAGDAVAQEIKYHPFCLAALYDRERVHQNAEEYNGFDKKDTHPTAFPEIVTYICEMNPSSKDTAPPTIFGLQTSSHFTKNSWRNLDLKQQMWTPQDFIPQLESLQHGYDVLLASQKDVGAILAQTSKYSEAIHLAKAASIIRKEMLQHKSACNAVTDGNIEEAASPTILQFVWMIEHSADSRA